MSKTVEQRRGENLHPLEFAVTFGEDELKLDVPEGIWNPTPHGMHLAGMLLELDFSGEHVLELGAGCGIHSILIARRGAARMTLSEIDQAVLDNARHNIEKHGVVVPIDYVVADWTNVAGGAFDALVTNPPFAKSGKRYRRYFIDRLILDAHKLVRPGGLLIFVQSSMADVPRSLRLMEENDMDVTILGEAEGPFREYYFEDPALLREMAAIPGGYSVRDGKHFERLIVFEARLPA